jgi:hypothetical protein
VCLELNVGLLSVTHNSRIGFTLSGASVLLTQPLDLLNMLWSAPFGAVVPTSAFQQSVFLP